MSGMDYNGTICADRVYTEDQLRAILDISPAQLDQKLKKGLRYCQESRQQKRESSGAEYHRYVERNSKCDADGVKE